MADEETLLGFIKKIAHEQKFDSFDVKITPVSSGGANYTSKLYRVKISAKGREDLNLFVKVALMSEKMRDQTTMNVFENERLAYTNLMKMYRHLEEKHCVPEESRLKFPKYYGSDMTYLQEILVLEDLTSRGFGSANRFESVDWQYAAAAITELAKFHALSIAYEHEYPTEFDTIPFPSGFFQENEDTNMFFNKMCKSALAAVRNENKEKLKKFMENQKFSIAYGDMLKPLRRKVLIHLDFRPNNMLHKVMEDGTTEVIPVDYQTIQGGSPVVDLIYFIFTATDGQFRAKYYQKLVDHYHSELSVALARLGLDVEDKYSRDDFEFEMKEKQSFGLLVSLMLLPILTVPEDQAPTMDGSLDVTGFAIEITSDLYSQRLNEVVDDFIQWGVL